MHDLMHDLMHDPPLSSRTKLSRPAAVVGTARDDTAPPGSAQVRQREQVSVTIERGCKPVQYARCVRTAQGRCDSQRGQAVRSSASGRHRAWKPVCPVRWRALIPREERCRRRATSGESSLTSNDDLSAAIFASSFCSRPRSDPEEIEGSSSPVPALTRSPRPLRTGRPTLTRTHGAGAAASQGYE